MPPIGTMRSNVTDPGGREGRSARGAVDWGLAGLLILATRRPKSAEAGDPPAI
jgi:hypothetical protein